MPSVERLINRQLERWNLERRLEREEASEAIGLEPRRPWIAISRQAGAGGGEVARRLAQDLGYRLFDREIVEAIAGRSDFRRATIESLDERTRSGLELYVEGMLQGRALEQRDYIRHLIEVVWGIGQHGHAILLGRAAHLILEPSAGLRVRLGAPLEDRVRRMSEAEELTAHEARTRITQLDEERVRFTRQYFHREADRIEDFDLAINTSALGIAGAVRLIERALQEKMGFGAVSESALRMRHA